MEEAAVLSGDNAFNAHFGECMAAIGDIDDDGYQGRWKTETCETSYIMNDYLLFDCIPWSQVMFTSHYCPVYCECSCFVRSVKICSFYSGCHHL